MAIYGPQSAFSVSMYSQRRIVVQFFKNNNAFKNGKLAPVDSTKISNKEGSRAVANLEYFISHYDLAPLQPYFKKNLTVVADSLGKLKSKGDYGLVGRYELRNEKFEWAKKQLGLSKFSVRYIDMEDRGEKQVYYRITKLGTILDTKGYDFIMDPELINDTTTEKFNGLPIQHIILKNKSSILKINEETITFEPSKIAQKLLANKAKLETYSEKNNAAYDHNYAVPIEWMSVTAETKSFQVKLIIDNLNFGISGNNIDITYVSYLYLIKKK